MLSADVPGNEQLGAIGARKDCGIALQPLARAPDHRTCSLPKSASAVKAAYNNQLEVEWRARWVRPERGRRFAGFDGKPPNKNATKIFVGVARRQASLYVQLRSGRRLGAQLRSPRSRICRSFSFLLALCHQAPGPVAPPPFQRSTILVPNTSRPSQPLPPDAQLRAPPVALPEPAPPLLLSNSPFAKHPVPASSTYSSTPRSVPCPRLFTTTLLCYAHMHYAPCLYRLVSSRPVPSPPSLVLLSPLPSLVAT